MEVIQGINCLYEVGKPDSAFGFNAQRTCQLVFYGKGSVERTVTEGAVEDWQDLPEAMGELVQSDPKSRRVELKRVNLNAVNPRKGSAPSWDIVQGEVLRYAVGTNNLDYVQRALRAGAKPNYYGYGMNWTLLADAARNGNKDIVAELLNEGADASLLGISGMTPLFFAAYQGHAEIVKILLPTTVSGFNGDAFQMCDQYKRGEGYPTERKVVYQYAGPEDHYKPSYEGESGILLVNWVHMLGNETALHAAVRYGHIGVVKVLLDDNRVDTDVYAVFQSIEINEEWMSFAPTPLVLAVLKKDVEMVRVFVEKRPRSVLCEMKVRDKTNVVVRPIDFANKEGTEEERQIYCLLEAAEKELLDDVEQWKAEAPVRIAEIEEVKAGGATWGSWEDDAKAWREERWLT